MIAIPSINEEALGASQISTVREGQGGRQRRQRRCITLPSKAVQDPSATANEFLKAPLPVATGGTGSSRRRLSRRSSFLSTGPACHPPARPLTSRRQRCKTIGAIPFAPPDLDIDTITVYDDACEVPEGSALSRGSGSFVSALEIAHPADDHTVILTASYSSSGATDPVKPTSPRDSRGSDDIYLYDIMRQISRAKEEGERGEEKKKPSRKETCMATTTMASTAVCSGGGGISPLVRREGEGNLKLQHDAQGSGEGEENVSLLEMMHRVSKAKKEKKERGGRDRGGGRGSVSSVTPTGTKTKSSSCTRTGPGVDAAIGQTGVRPPHQMKKRVSMADVTADITRSFGDVGREGGTQEDPLSVCKSILFPSSSVGKRGDGKTDYGGGVKEEREVQDEEEEDDANLSLEEMIRQVSETRSRSKEGNPLLNKSDGDKSMSTQIQLPALPPDQDHVLPFVSSSSKSAFSSPLQQPLFNPPPAAAIATTQRTKSPHARLPRTGRRDLFSPCPSSPKGILCMLLKDEMRSAFSASPVTSRASDCGKTGGRGLYLYSGSGIVTTTAAAVRAPLSDTFCAMKAPNSAAAPPRDLARKEETSGGEGSAFTCAPVSRSRRRIYEIEAPQPKGDRCHRRSRTKPLASVVATEWELERGPQGKEEEAAKQTRTAKVHSTSLSDSLTAVAAALKAEQKKNGGRFTFTDQSMEMFQLRSSACVPVKWREKALASFFAE
uniref:Uncharacterized protein n=1 Tax=Chromera velia CCMP2878 TaxID=1169474 RepID=A0A0G4HV03_9ALVE|eukprot:Cvel_1398.t1-p1 / transcript=Cvel_1398.t1 / gene=Cvel_1398 / organism=Chromera_velia_CCMP2878 / gene_product=hypothetical protein / transcript_product=hypothetical protein / location=Cvel_scaffold48:158808-160973(+) / protein_length=722 / sequence_SO=supercontig / SO=protein_coding / is_pseudo=false